MVSIYALMSIQKMPFVDGGKLDILPSCGMSHLL